MSWQNLVAYRWKMIFVIILLGRFQITILRFEVIPNTFKTIKKQPF